MDNETVLNIHRLSIRKGRRWIFKDFNFRLKRGVTALLGPNGAGKTTLFESLLQVEKANAGKVTLYGEAISSQEQVLRYRKNLGYMPQRWGSFPGFKAIESVEYAAWIKGVPSSELRPLSMLALEKVSLLDDAFTPIRKMSGGMQQRVGLAEALVTNPSLVLLDEPTVGLDPAQRANLHRNILESSVDRAILFSTHLTEDVRALAEHVLVLQEGKIAFSGAPEELAACAQATDGRGALEEGYLSIIQPSTGRQ